MHNMHPVPKQLNLHLYWFIDIFLDFNLMSKRQQCRMQGGQGQESQTGREATR